MVFFCLYKLLLELFFPVLYNGHSVNNIVYKPIHRFILTTSMTFTLICSFDSLNLTQYSYILNKEKQTGTYENS